MDRSSLRRRAGGLAAAATLGTTVLAFAGAPGPASAAPQPKPFTAALTNVDSGRTVEVPVGTPITVNLTATGARFAWSAPKSADRAVVPGIGWTRPDGGAAGVFFARAPGTATISAVSTCRPQAGEVCPFVAILWQATIHVT
jgi:hypothetical protein